MPSIQNTGLINDANLQGYWKFDQTEDTNTKLLLHFNGANNATTTAESSSGRAITFVGNAKISTTEKKFGSASLYLDGTGDYLTVPDSTDWDLGTGDFTMDLWARFDDNTRSSTFFTQSQDNNNRWQFSYIAGGTPQLYMDVIVGGTGPIAIASNWTPTNDVWYHIALTRNGNDFRFFVDGTQVGTTKTSSGSFSTFASVLYIGTHWISGTPSTPHKGYLDEVRFVKGTAKYTANFTAPTTPYSFQVDDYSKNGYHLTTGTRPTNVTGLFDQAGDFESGSSQYVANAGANCNVTGSQTWSCWFKPESNNINQALMYLRNSGGGNARGVIVLDTGRVRWDLDGLSSGNGLSPATVLQNGTWYHICCVYDSVAGLTKVFINGVKQQTTTTGTPSTITGNFVVARGGDRNEYYVDGIIDDISLFDRALTDSEVYQIYLSFTPKISIID